MRTGIALGSNVGDRWANLCTARRELLALPIATGPEVRSSIYETEPVDADGAAFLNAVIEIEFEGAAVTLLDALQSIEAKLGRPSKRPRNAPRTIDLDILYVGNLALTNEEIVIPHPRLHQRRFVLQPLAEIRPELLLPGQSKSVAELLAGLRDDAAVRLYRDSWE